MDGFDGLKSQLRHAPSIIVSNELTCNSYCDFSQHLCLGLNEAYKYNVLLMSTMLLNFALNWEVEYLKVHYAIKKGIESEHLSKTTLLAWYMWVKDG